MNDDTSSAVSVRAGRDKVVAETGPWIATNIYLGNGVFTMDHDRVGTADVMAYAITQAVADLSGKPLSELRILDLGCGEGG